jgi:uncharacterized integral membrane protein
MYRLLPLIAVTVSFASFAFANAREVAVHFVVGATQLPLIVLLLGSFGAGALSVILHGTVEAAERRALERRARRDVKRLALRRLEVE